MFTADQAFEAQQDGEPIMIGLQDVVRMIQSHCLDVTDIHAPDFPKATEGRYDAADVLGWLGY